MILQNESGHTNQGDAKENTFEKSKGGLIILNEDLTEKWHMQQLTKEDVRAWIKQQKEHKDIEPQNFEHVVHCLYQIYLTYHNKATLGHFLTAVTENKLIEAVYRADGTNIKILPLYVTWLYWVAPADYKIRMVA